MIRRSAAIAAITILLSLMVHVFGLGLTVSVQPSLPLQESTSDIVALGNEFEDFAEPVVEPLAPEPATAPEPPEVQPQQPENAEIPTSDAKVASANPQLVRAPDTGVAQSGTEETASQEETPGPEIETIEPTNALAGVPAEDSVGPPVQTVEPAPAQQPETGDTAEPVDSQEAASADAPAQQSPTAQPVPATPAPAIAPEATASAVLSVPQNSPPVDPVVLNALVEPVPNESPDSGEEDQTEPAELGVTTSLRPRLPLRRRPADQLASLDRPASQNALRPDSTQRIESPLAAYRRDGTDLTIRRNSGSRSGRLGFLGSGGPGNSDVTNYVGRVLVHLNRTPPVPVSGRGYARVIFEISPETGTGGVRFRWTRTRPT
ncbi:MAG: hypothetical protein AAF408_03620 [Pseudomonadota bacterium]